VLELDSKSILRDFRKEIYLCPINSGATRPFPHPRGPETFSKIEDYPYETWRAKRKRGERVVELCVDGGIIPVHPYVRRVVRMRGDEELGVLFERKSPAT
jgi:hypothetical protein